jgi:hypothetical protein
LDSFFAVALCSAHSTPDVWLQTHPSFRAFGVGHTLPHHTPIRIKAVTSGCRATRLPLARCVPQKTVGSLSCPIVSLGQILWFPRGSSFSMAHDRGVTTYYQVKWHTISHRVRQGPIR